MTVHHLRKRRYDWKDIFDYGTFWILTFSAVVLSSGIFALFSISQNHPLRISVTWNSRGLTAAPILRRRAALFTRNYRHAVHRLPTGP
jgi:hypothetical protein